MARRDPTARQAVRRVLESKHLIADPWIGLRRDSVLLPIEGHVSDHLVFEYPDWVDVIALTADLNIVLVEQFRHPIRRLRTEFPAGAVERNETPLAAIQRELREETGYASDDWHLLGSAPVNPTWQDNRIHSFLALGAGRHAEQDLDEGEVIQTRELPFADFVGKVEAGAIELPALQLGGLYLLQTYVRRSSDAKLAQLKAHGVL
jgi:8-oxo-dGTP pyrophosphatase MutT (NUDIX family)